MARNSLAQETDAPTREIAYWVVGTGSVTGDPDNFNPRVHVLAADGALRPDGTFVLLPPVPEALVLDGLRHPVHNQVRAAAGDPEGRKKLAGT